MKLNIIEGKPTAEDWVTIGRMIDEGYHTGIGMPYGITWKLEDE